MQPRMTSSLLCKLPLAFWGIYLVIYLTFGVCGGVHTHHRCETQRTTCRNVFSFHRVSSGDPTQVFSLDDKPLYPLIHLPPPPLTFIKIRLYYLSLSTESMKTLEIGSKYIQQQKRVEQQLPLSDGLISMKKVYNQAGKIWAPHCPF